MFTKPTVNCSTLTGDSGGGSGASAGQHVVLSAAELGRRRDIERSAGRIADLLLEGLLARPS